MERYFSYDIAYSSYDLFCKTIIVEFRRLILKHLNIEIDIPRATRTGVKFQAPEVDSHQKENVTDDYEKLSNILRDLIKFLGEQKKLKNCTMPKYDLIAVVSTFEQVARNRQVEYFYAFLVTLISVAPKNKEVKLMLDDINRYASTLISKGK